MNSRPNSIFVASDFNYESDMYCPPFNDTDFSWPATLVNTTAYQYCNGIKHQAHRHCLSTGKWGEVMNYSSCNEVHDQKRHSRNDSGSVFSEEEIMHAQILVKLTFYGGVISLVLLVISLITLHIFGSVKNIRTNIHKHLIISFILRFLEQVVWSEPFIFGHAVWFFSKSWMCRYLLTMHHLFAITNFSWMLVEGVYLHIILVVRPLSRDNIQFIFFHILGWVIPIVVAASWAIVMHFEDDTICWWYSYKLPYIYIIYTPILLSLFINLLILINLVRIIVLKVCTGNRPEPRKIWRTIKSTVVLFFLLGVINLMMITSGDGSNAQATRIYRYVNTVLPNCQGIFVAVFYCGFNAEAGRNGRQLKATMWRCKYRPMGTHQEVIK